MLRRATAGSSVHDVNRLVFLQVVLTAIACAGPEPAPVEIGLDARARELVDRYRAAHEAGDLDALKALVHWGDSTEDTRERIEIRLARGLGLEIRSIEFRPLTGSEDFEVGEYGPGLEVAGWLAVIFVPPPEDARFFGVAFVVGELDGGLALCVAEPNPR